MKARFLILFLLPLKCMVASVDSDSSIFAPNQTSASLLIRYSEEFINEVDPSAKEEAKKKHVLAYDIYIKARSYAILNKLFFWLSLVFGVLVLLWPSLSIVFKDKLSHWEWVKSATVQTTVTALAALMFTFYSDYKSKQTYAETLMRHVVYSSESTETLASTVSEELAKIDRGFSFHSILSNKADSESGSEGY